MCQSHEHEELMSCLTSSSCVFLTGDCCVSAVGGLPLKRRATVDFNWDDNVKRTCLVPSAYFLFSGCSMHYETKEILPRIMLKEDKDKALFCVIQFTMKGMSSLLMLRSMKQGKSSFLHGRVKEVMWTSPSYSIPHITLWVESIPLVPIAKGNLKRTTLESASAPSSVGIPAIASERRGLASLFITSTWWTQQKPFIACAVLARFAALNSATEKGVFSSTLSKKRVSSFSSDFFLLIDTQYDYGKNEQSLGRARSGFDVFWKNTLSLLIKE